LKRTPRLRNRSYTERVSGLVFPEEKRDHVRSTHEEIAVSIERGDAET
jgi:hypothetical protein